MMPLSIALATLEACCYKVGNVPAALGALQDVKNELESLRVCASCRHTELYHEYCEEIARHEGRVLNGHPQPNGKDLVGCSDNCHFPLSRWEKRTNEPLP